MVSKLRRLQLKAIKRHQGRFVSSEPKLIPKCIISFLRSIKDRRKLCQEDATHCIRVFRGEKNRRCGKDNKLYVNI